LFAASVAPVLVIDSARWCSQIRLRCVKAFTSLASNNEVLDKTWFFRTFEPKFGRLLP